MGAKRRVMPETAAGQVDHGEHHDERHRQNAGDLHPARGSRIRLSLHGDLFYDT